MANITIRDLDSRTMALLRSRAVERRHSVDEEARQILRTAVLTETAEDDESLAVSIMRRVKAAGGGIDLKIPARGLARSATRRGA